MSPDQGEPLACGRHIRADSRRLRPGLFEQQRHPQGCAGSGRWRRPEPAAGGRPLRSADPGATPYLSYGLYLDLAIGQDRGVRRAGRRR